MKTNKYNSNTIELIGKYISGEMSGNEAKEFILSLDDDSESKNLLHKMQNDWNTIGNYKGKEKVNTDKAWNNLISKLEEEQLVLPETESYSFVSRVVFSRWAAVALILLTTGILFFTRYQHEQFIVIQNPSSSETLVQTLSDGSTVYLASNSELKYPEKFIRDKRTVWLKGEAFFDISHNPEMPFVIEAHDMQVEVLGTSFNLKSNEQGDFELMVETGLVKVSKKVDPSVSDMVRAGEKLQFVDNNLIKSSTIDKEYLGWRVNRMRFKDERLADIVQIINRNYNSNLILSSQELGERRLTVTFNDNSLDTITFLICKALVLKADVKDSTITFSEE